MDQDHTDYFFRIEHHVPLCAALIFKRKFRNPGQIFRQARLLGDNTSCILLQSDKIRRSCRNHSTLDDRQSQTEQTLDVAGLKLHTRSYSLTIKGFNGCSGCLVQRTMPHGGTRRQSGSPDIRIRCDCDVVELKWDGEWSAADGSRDRATAIKSTVIAITVDFHLGCVDSYVSVYRPCKRRGRRIN